MTTYSNKLEDFTPLGKRHFWHTYEFKFREFFKKQLHVFQTTVYVHILQGIFYFYFTTFTQYVAPSGYFFLICKIPKLCEIALHLRKTLKFLQKFYSIIIIVTFKARKARNYFFSLLFISMLDEFYLQCIPIKINIH